jgi:UDP-GlcNAc:undecaprenyl-phosphate GlcNAc-1-phosphate transferase
MDFSFLQYICVILSFTLVTYLTTPIFRALAIKLNIVDKPGGRKLQKYAIPYLGGLAIIIPLLFSLTLLTFIPIFKVDRFELLFGLVLPGVLMAIVGLLDDIYQLSALSRLISQSVAGFTTSYLLYSSNSGIQIFDNSILNLFTTTVWIIGIINAFNFIDNMDGLAGGVAMFAALGFFVISLSNGQLLVAALSAAICGSCIGFLFWNKNPARIYMGDSGALFLGFMLAAISIRVDSGGSNYLQSIFTPLVMLAIPFIDTAQVIISRLRRGVSPLQGGRDHISHKLLLLGVNEKAAVQIIWLCAIIFSLIAITISGVLN